MQFYIEFRKFSLKYFCVFYLVFFLMLLYYIFIGQKLGTVFMCCSLNLFLKILSCGFFLINRSVFFSS